MVEWNTDIVVGSGEARAPAQFVHLRTRAGTASEISISTNRGEMRGTSSEIVIRERWQSSSSITMSLIGSRSTIAAMAHARVERGGIRCTAAVSDRAAVCRVGRLPVNGLQALIKLGRTSKFPLAENSPEDNDTTDTGSHYNEGGQCS